MNSRTSLSWACAVALAAAAACSDSPAGVTSPDASLRGKPTYSISPVVSGGGTFWSFTADNSGPEFWDLSESLDGASCNIGFFAAGTYGPCANERPGTSLNQGGFLGGRFLGNSPSGSTNANFMLPAGSYRVTFLGGARGAGTGGYPENTIGYYTAGSGGKIFTAFPSVATNGTEIITVSSDWGLYIQPGSAPNNPAGGCATNTWCSGEATSTWAMFKSLNGEKYLFGVEDSPDASIDYDFNDHFIAFESLEANGTGRMTGGFTIESDAYRNLKTSLTIHCDNKLSNNIEINWNNGQNWHLDKNSLSDIVCQKLADPRPPVADINVFKGNATGTLNNVAGSRLSFTFVDRGEPGREDRVTLKIWNAANQVVLDVADVQIKTGNIQAHIDQPHK